MSQNFFKNKQSYVSKVLEAAPVWILNLFCEQPNILLLKKVDNFVTLMIDFLNKEDCLERGFKYSIPDPKTIAESSTLAVGELKITLTSKSALKKLYPSLVKDERFDSAYNKYELFITLLVVAVLYTLLPPEYGLKKVLYLKDSGYGYIGPDVTASRYRIGIAVHDKDFIFSEWWEGSVCEVINKRISEFTKTLSFILNKVNQEYYTLGLINWDLFYLNKYEVSNNKALCWPFLTKKGKINYYFN